jgi:hypothetical protein
MNKLLYFMDSLDQLEGSVEPHQAGYQERKA